MSFYSQYDHDLAAKIKHLNQAVVEGWITRAEALARARALDPELKVCPCCGQWPCDCTMPIPAYLIEEAIKRHVK